MRPQQSGSPRIRVLGIPWHRISRLLLISCVLIPCALLALLLAGAAWANSPASTGGRGHPALKAIDQAWQAGELTDEDVVLYRFYLVVDRQKLPPQFRVGPPLLCGTNFVLEAWHRRDDLSPAARAEILAYRNDFSMQETRETAHFMIHYDTSGPDAVPDLAYVDSVAVACERGWVAYHLEKGWDIPPGDGGYGGGWDKTDCTIRHGGGLGHAEIIAPVPGGAPYDYTAEFFIDPNIAPTCLLQSVVVHEYMHVVQVGYGFVVDAGWYLENSAVLAQEWAYDACDVYVDWLPWFFDQPCRRLTTRDGAYEYGASVWPMYQAERFDVSVVERIWERFQWNGNMLVSHAEVLADYGYTMGSAYLEFMRWCFYTAYRADPAHFEEAHQWPVRLLAQRSHSSYPTGNQHPIIQPDVYGTAILLFERETGNSDPIIDFTINGPECTLGVQFLVKSPGEQSYSEYSMNLDSHGDGVFSLGGFDAADSVFMLVSMNMGCGGAQDFVYSAATRPDLASAPAEPAMAMRLESLAVRPNPAFGAVTLNYHLPAAAHVEIDILSPDGKLLRRLIRAHRAAGPLMAIWDCRDGSGRPLSGGVYLARVRVGGEWQSRKIILAR